MPAFLHDLRYSVRTLRKSPGFALTAILTLALGIGAVTAIFSVVDAVLLKPLELPHPGQLVMIREGTELPLDNPQHFLNWQARSQTLSRLAAFQPASFSIIPGKGRPSMIPGLRITPNFFSVLGISPMLGRTFLPAETIPGHNSVAILSWGGWQQYFHGDPSVIGRTLRIAEWPETVVGVLPKGFRFPHIGGPWDNASQAGQPYQIFVPVNLESNGTSDDGNYNYLAIGRLKPGVTIEQAQAELTTIQDAYNKAHRLETNPQPRVQPLLAVLTGQVSTGLWLLLAAVGAVLLIACVNLANLQLARAVARERELAVRAALGAARERLVESALADSLVLAIAGGALGILFAFGLVRLFVSLAPANLPRIGSIAISWPVLLAAAALSIFTAVLFGFMPALRSMRVDPQTALQSGTVRASTSRESRRTRQFLVAAEVACTLALLVVTGLLGRSFEHLLHQNRDFDSSHVTVAEVYLGAPRYAGALGAKGDAARAAFDRRALADLTQIPGVQSVAMTSETPMEGDSWIDSVNRPDRPLPPNLTPSANIRWISPGYARTLRIPVVEGRSLQPFDKDHESNALISEDTAKQVWPGQDPIGRTFDLQDGSGRHTVVGVLADARINDLQSTANMVYLPYWQNPWWRPNFLIRSSLPTSQLAPSIRRTLWNIDPQVAIPLLKSLDQQVSDSVATQRFQTLLLSSFGAAALLLAILGIYGVLAYSVSLRRQEFGIRLALGSGKAALMRFVAREAALPIAGGVAAGLLLAFAATRWIHSLLYDTSAASPAVIAAAVALLLAAGLLASLLPARRAANTDPMQVLRNE